MPAPPISQHAKKNPKNDDFTPLERVLSQKTLAIESNIDPKESESADNQLDL